MAANKEDSRPAYRALEVFFHPTAGRTTSADVLTVDYRGDRRIVHRIGSISLRVGRGDLVGLTASEVTWVLVDQLHSWLQTERSGLAHTTDAPPSRVAAPASPEGTTGAAVDPLRTDTLPEL